MKKPSMIANLTTLIAVLTGIIIILAFAPCTPGQKTFHRDIELVRVEGQKQRVLAYRRATVLYDAAGNQTETSISTKGRMKTRWELEPNEALIGPSFTESTDVVIKEIDEDPITVSCEGFSDVEQGVIRQALESWNVGATRFAYQPKGGQVAIRRHSLPRLAAQSTMDIVDGRLVSAVVQVDPRVVSLKALESAIAHEAGHWLGLPDSRDKGSVMYFESKGVNRDNGHVGPSSMDLTLISNHQQRQLPPSP